MESHSNDSAGASVSSTSAPNNTPASGDAAPSAVDRVRAVIDLANSFDAATNADSAAIRHAVDDAFGGEIGREVPNALIAELIQAVRGVRRAPGVAAVRIVLHGGGGGQGQGQAHGHGHGQGHGQGPTAAQRDARDEARGRRARARAERERRIRFEAERRARICGRSDREALRRQERADDLEEMNRMFLGQRVQLTEVGRDELAAMDLPVPRDGVLYVRHAS
ncbi:hypothetical protein LTR36_006081 [Oleoguttula mirabilis]|uniref:Uncharacterized protein n=1 Tax=Oleoguttula mirabilis TaxID=1507867 RepID=A0AAV9JDH1_9PEZI|nr:hypothetical protein LTR36_006081 [Oleoguttula mirabilis]